MGKLDATEKTFVGFAAIIVCGVVAFWATIGYVAVHFIAKLW